MKSSCSVLLILLAAAGLPCSASDVQIEAPNIVRSAVSTQCQAEANSAGVTGRAWHEARAACMRKNSVPTPLKALTKRCLADAEGRKGEEWQQFVLDCIAPALFASA